MQGCQAEGREKVQLLMDISGDHKHSKDPFNHHYNIFLKVNKQEQENKNFDLYMSPSVKANLKYILGNGNAMCLKELNLVVAETPGLVMSPKHLNIS